MEVEEILNLLRIPVVREHRFSQESLGEEIVPVVVLPGSPQENLGEERMVQWIEENPMQK
ncbi:hypothetical protein Hamer_G009784 [Homarus americanus]|uniref:Uncharacterized protein n=2 Tax=Homarus americanus TaxID=6706 RepID=A0A8J5NAF0_HOMAM|nr:hypothetical protein Hamer_G009784 [Homarus americanus]